MHATLAIWFQKNLGSLLLVGGLVTYVVVAGRTNSCALCASITGALGLNAAAAPADRPVAPGWEVKDLDGNALGSASLRGKVVVLDFWATWCPPCRKEIQGFVDIQKRLGDKGVQVVGLSAGEEPNVVKKFGANAAVNYPLAVDDGRIAEAFGGVNALPTTFVIDRTGRIAARHVGYTSVKEFERDILPLLSETN
jgi:peroxiredoxin